MKLNNNYEYLDKTTLNYINQLIGNDSEFDEERFNNWLFELDVFNKRNPSAYVKYCFKGAYEKGTFKRVVKPKDYSLEKHKLWYLIKAYETDFYDGLKAVVIIDYVIDNQILTPNELEELLIKIFNYIKTQEEKITIGKIVDLLSISNALKGKIDWEVINQKYNEHKKIWESIDENEAKL